MKKLLFGLMIVMTGCASVDLSPTSNIIDLPGQSKQAIYDKSIQWVTYKFVSGRAVMDYKDRGTGRIIAKGQVFLDRFANYAQYVTMIATIDSVNGRAKITISPTGCRVNNLDCPCNGNYLMPGALSKIQPEIITFTEDYKSYMTGGNAPAWDGR